MAQTKTKPTEVNVRDFISAVENATRREDAKGCLYINKLADVDTAVLAKILRLGVAATKKTWPVTAS